MWKKRRGAGLLRVDFPFRAYVNGLEQPHCLRNMRVSGAWSNHTATVAPQQNRSEADFPQQLRNKPAPGPPRRQCVPRLRLKTAGVRHTEEF